MAIIYGQIDSLKQIREILENHGITQFNSIGQLNSFLLNYNDQKDLLQATIEQDYQNKLDLVIQRITELQENFREVDDQGKRKLKSFTYKLKRKCVRLKSTPYKNVFADLGNWYWLQLLLGFLFLMSKCEWIIINLIHYRQKQKLKESIESLNREVLKLEELKEKEIKEELYQLKTKKSIIKEIQPLISGAIGENKVVQELKRLPDDHFVINDFSINFSPPLYNRNNNDRIFSIQLDHLVISRAGIFILETKNWSKKSVDNEMMRSPVDQIKRSSYALFTLINSNSSSTSIKLDTHHWGDRKIPIRNVIVLMKHKPKSNFNYVAIKTLSELNQYITFFEPIFLLSEAEEMFKYLKGISNT